MKKHTAEEAAKIPTLGRGRHTYVHVMLLQLKVGEGITIEKGIDWVSKTPPNQLVRRFGKKHNRKFKIEKTLENTGWLVIRLS